MTGTEIVAIIGLIGTIVGTLGGSIASGILQIYKDRQTLVQEQELELEKEERQRLQEIYSKCFECLIAYRAQSISGFTVDVGELKKLFNETVKWLLLLTIYYRDKESEALKTFGELVFCFVKNDGNADDRELEDLIKAICKLAVADTVAVHYTIQKNASRVKLK